MTSLHADYNPVNLLAIVRFGRMRTTWLSPQVEQKNINVQKSIC